MIEPAGGIYFKNERYIKTGKGYLTCIRVYEYPENVDDFWLAGVLLESNCTITMDIGNYDRTESVENLRSSIKELEGRSAVEKFEINSSNIFWKKPTNFPILSDLLELVNSVLKEHKGFLSPYSMWS